MQRIQRGICGIETTEMRNNLEGKKNTNYSSESNFYSSRNSDLECHSVIVKQTLWKESE